MEIPIISPLHYSVLHGDEIGIDVGLEKGHSPNHQEFQWGRTPLHFSTMTNNLRIAEKLLQAKADPNIISRDKLTALYIAVFNGSKEMVELLLKYNCASTLNYKNEISGRTPLALAVEKNELDIVKILIKYKAMINYSSIDGQSLLQLSLKKRNQTMACFLAKNCCRCVINRRDPYSHHTPLHTAIIRRYYDVVKVLLKKNADMNARTPTGCLPINLAASKFDPEMSRIMTKYGLKISTFCVDKYFSVDKALEEYRRRIQEYASKV